MKVHKPMLRGTEIEGCEKPGEGELVQVKTHDGMLARPFPGALLRAQIKVVTF